jgi:hypothetical protein
VLVPGGLLEDAVPRGGATEKDDQDQRKEHQRAERPLGEPGGDGGGVAGRLGRGEGGQRERARRVARPGEPGQRKRRQHDEVERQDDPEVDGRHHPVEAVAPAQQQQGGGDADQPVRGQDVSGVEQNPVYGAEPDQPGVPPQQQPAGGGRVRAGRLLPPPQLHQPVAEEQREQWQRASMNQQHQEQVVRPLGADRVRLQPRCRGEEHSRGVGHGDQQQHAASGQVGRQGAVPSGGRPEHPGGLVGQRAGHRFSFSPSAD